MKTSKIEWTDAVWNPVRGCSRVSEGCRNCYAERQAARFAHGREGYEVGGEQDGFVTTREPGYMHGFVEQTPGGPRWTGRVELVPFKLAEPLSWRKPRRVFVNSMSDLFHKSLPDEAIDRVFAVMAMCPQHTFQVLTKRPERMRAYFYKNASLHDRERCIERAASTFGRALPARSDWALPLPNVWLGTSIEDQASADARLPNLLATPAAVRFVSAEPLLGPVDFGDIQFPGARMDVLHGQGVATRGVVGQSMPNARCNALDWVIVGGESGPGARPCDVAWIRSIVEQCKAASTACFVKQLGANPVARSVEDLGEDVFAALNDGERGPVTDGDFPMSVPLLDRKGGDPHEWPEYLRIREFPGGVA